MLLLLLLLAIYKPETPKHSACKIFMCNPGTSPAECNQHTERAETAKTTKTNVLGNGNEHSSSSPSLGRYKRRRIHEEEITSNMLLLIRQRPIGASYSSFHYRSPPSPSPYHPGIHPLALPLDGTSFYNDPPSPVTK